MKNYGSDKLLGVYWVSTSCQVPRLCSAKLRGRVFCFAHEPLFYTTILLNPVLTLLSIQPVFMEVLSNDTIHDAVAYAYRVALIGKEKTSEKFCS